MSFVEDRTYERVSLDIDDSVVTKTRYKALGKKLQAQTDDWRKSAHTLSPCRAYDPQEFKAKQLRSTLDQHSYPSKSPQRPSKVKEAVYQIDPKKVKQYSLTRVEHSPARPEASVVTLEVSGLKAGCTDEDLRGLCKGFHMVAVNTDYDRFTGKCTGKALLKARVPDGEAAKRLNSKLAQKGYRVNEVVTKAGRNSNFFDCKGTSFLDATTEVAQRRLTAKFSNSRSKPDLKPGDSFYQRMNPRPRMDESFKELKKWEQTRRTPSRSTSASRR
jgi:hypothetical protein